MNKTWADKFGKVCKKCNKRHGVFKTSGHNLPIDNNKCKKT